MVESVHLKKNLSYSLKVNAKKCDVLRKFYVFFKKYCKRFHPKILNISENDQKKDCNFWVLCHRRLIWLWSHLVATNNALVPTFSEWLKCRPKEFPCLYKIDSEIFPFKLKVCWLVYIFGIFHFLYSLKTSQIS